MNTPRRTLADEPVADAYFFDRRRRRAGGTKQYYGAYYADIIDDSDRYAVELAGRDRFICDDIVV